MDINKENTKYLASLLSNCGATQDEINDLSFDDEVGFFESNRLADWFVSQINFGWRVWQAAKAHEAEKLKGCVLVPVQCPDPDFADSLFDELSKKAIGEFGDDLLIHFSDIDEEKIWALMVEAAKAQAVPEWKDYELEKPNDGQKCLVIFESKDCEDAQRWMCIDEFNEGMFDFIANWEDQCASVALPAGSIISKVRAVCWTTTNLSNAPLSFDQFYKEPAND